MVSINQNFKLPTSMNSQPIQIQQQQQQQQFKPQQQQPPQQQKSNSCFSDQENYPANIQPSSSTSSSSSSSIHITKSMVIRPPLESNQPQQPQQPQQQQPQQQQTLQQIHHQQVQLQQQQSLQMQQQQLQQQQQQQQMPPPQSLPNKSNEPQEPIVVYETIRSGDSKRLKEYRQGEFLGKGGFAKCYLMTEVETNRIYAAKIIPKSTLQKTRARSKLKSEIKIHSSLSHENIVKFEHCFENEENVYILLELCNQKTVMDIHKKRKYLMEYETKYYVYQVIMAVQYLHNNNIIHRDLKLGNLFIDNMRIKLGDFGLSTKVEHGERKKTICGTPNYIAPEILDNSNGHSYEVDVWSIGIILYTLLIGKPPFETSDVKHTYQRIKQNQYSFPDEPIISHSAKSLIISILNPVPEQRPNLSQILEHDFFTYSPIPKYLPVSSLTTAPSQSTINQNMGRPLSEKTNIVNQQHLQLAGTTSPTKNNNHHYQQQQYQQQQPQQQQQQQYNNNYQQSFSPKKQINNMNNNMNNNNMNNNMNNNNNLKQYNYSNNNNINNNNNNNINNQFANLSPNSQQKLSEVENDDFHYRKLRRLEKMKENDLKTQLLIKQQYTNMNENQQQRVNNNNININNNNNNNNNNGNTVTVTTGNNTVNVQIKELETKIANNHISDSPPVSSNNNYPQQIQKQQPNFNNEFHLGIPNNLVYISQYADFTNKYGLAYVLSNSYVGAYFNDSTKIVTLIESEIAYYMEHAKGTDGDGRRVLNVTQQHPHDTQKKVTLIKYFLNHFTNSDTTNLLINTGATSSLINNNNNVENVTNNNNNNNNSSSNINPIYVKKWIKFDNGIAFRLSDKTIQVNYLDKSRIIVSSKDMVTFVPYRGQIITGTLNYFKNCDKKISEKIKYIYGTLSNSLYSKKPESSFQQLPQQQQQQQQYQQPQNYQQQQPQQLPQPQQSPAKQHQYQPNQIQYQQSIPQPQLINQ
ncbi:hypothetical protein ACTFIW_005304 [Dictyostelium discoideum]